MTKEDRIKLYLTLSAPFPEEAIERTEGRITGRGYDTAGIKYQFLADRLNEVLGVGGFRTDRTITVKTSVTANGRPAFEAIAEVRLELGEWIDGRFMPFAQAWGDGGHTALTEADARKGSYTNAFKKAAAFLGPGREAYRGTIDDDHIPADGVGHPVQPAPRGPGQRRPAPRAGAQTPASRAPDSTPAAGDRGKAAPAPAPANSAQPTRNRLSSKQYAALRSLSKTTGYDDKIFKAKVRERYGVEPGYLSMSQASELIDLLLAKQNGNGNGNGAREAD